MKIQNILSITLISLFSFTGVFAASTNEEQECFKLLNKEIKNHPVFTKNKQIFPSGDLSKVLLNQKGGSYIDLSDYNTFLKNREKNPSYKPFSHGTKGLDAYDFLMRRQHIATIISSDNSIITNIVGLGNDSNFKFPLPAKGEKSYGDDYKMSGNTFKEILAYTHHSITGDFLSCGIFKVSPADKRNFSNISDAGYFTNILNGIESQKNYGNSKCQSAFEGKNIKSNDMSFYSMKTDVCVLDYAENDFVKMELLSIAYDNKSPYFNEYLIFPLQVEAMSDMNARSKGLVKIRETFLDKVAKKTCLQMIHPSKNTLPKSCNKKYSGEKISYTPGNFMEKLYSSLFPTTFAAREFNFSQEDIDNAAGMVVYENMSYELYQKLLDIKSENFRDYLKLSLAPNFEEYILERKKQGIVVSPYEETFLSCNISYSDREKIIIDFLENLEDPQNINFENLTYSDVRFGDCIVPYPDKRNLSKVIPGSFSSNQLLAKQLSGEYEYPEIDGDMREYIEKSNKATLDYQQKIEQLTLDFNEGIINSDELNQKIEQEKTLYEQKMEQVIAENGISKEIESAAKNLDNGGFIPNFEKQLQENKLAISIAVALILIGFGVLIAILRKKK